MEKLLNKAYKDYSYVSRYSSFPYYYHAVDDKYVSGITAYLSDTTPFTLHTIEQGDNFDKLAMDYYGNHTLYWVICSFNHISNPFSELSIGSKIKIPAISNIIYDMNGRA